MPAEDMSAVVVFTAKSIDETFEQGGTGNWKLNAERVKKCKYVVLTANSHHRHSKHPKDKHRCAFLIGIISGVTSEVYDDLRNKVDDRWIIQFSKYVEVDLSIELGASQNPVKYINNVTDLSPDLAQRIKSFDWKPFPVHQVIDQTQIGTSALTIEEAKIGIAKKLGITPDCIEITIRT